MKVINIFVAVLISLILGLGLAGCEGDDIVGPASDDLEKFLGSWKVSDNAARINYTVNIQRNPSNSSQLLLVNFGDDGGSAKALVVGINMIIDEQPIGQNYSSSGEGTYVNASRLEFSFSLNDGIDIQRRNAVYTK